MGSALIEKGEKVHIITRRIFPEDLRRHFAGTVREVSGDVIRAEGYTFIFNLARLEYVRRPEVRTRIFGLGDGQQIVNVISPEVDVQDLHYRTIDDRLYFTNGKKFRLDINEFGPAY